MFFNLMPRQLFWWTWTRFKPTVGEVLTGLTISVNSTNLLFSVGRMVVPSLRPWGALDLWFLREIWVAFKSNFARKTSKIPISRSSLTICAMEQRHGRRHFTGFVLFATQTRKCGRCSGVDFIRIFWALDVCCLLLLSTVDRQNPRQPVGMMM